MEGPKKVYETRVNQDLLTDAILGKNRIKLYQQHFQKKDGFPVHMKGQYGVPFTRFMLWGATIACVVSVGLVGMMATNTLPKKKRS
ncbi:Cytochrome c oxidase subunit 7A- protein, mitochondrial [Desmophyllum pertusum]|uniref:Cytochrome c oxidase subunit 7A- protein, mitochondrial n=1 Tax=Desmophyllum pertusum TaxID=174260 RepID=A0A9W9Z587_9CNID|nr:Cytochrome c oxidase subunit 7A- protein, mitochondrial [Desmophyllum pertusum]